VFSLINAARPTMARFIFLPVMLVLALIAGALLEPPHPIM
jgi:hypothetical protein